MHPFADVSHEWVSFIVVEVVEGGCGFQSKLLAAAESARGRSGQWCISLQPCYALRLHPSILSIIEDATSHDTNLVSMMHDGGHMHELE